MTTEIRVKENNLSTKAVNGVIMTSSTTAGSMGGATVLATVGMVLTGPVGVGVGFLLGLAGGAKAGYSLGKKLTVQ